MSGDEYKSVIGKSIKDLEQTYSGQEELHSAKKRNLILGASLGVLLIIFCLVTFFGNRESPVATTPPPNNQRALVATEPDDLFSDAQNDLFDELTGDETESETGEPLDEEPPDADEGAEGAPQEESPPPEEDVSYETANEPPVTTPEAPATAPIPPSEVETISHLVRYGDNFASISGLYYNTEAYAEALASFNNMSMNDMLYIGSYLRIPVDPAQM